MKGDDLPHCVFQKDPLVNTEDEAGFRQNIHMQELCLYSKQSITYASGKV